MFSSPYFELLDEEYYSNYTRSLVPSKDILPINISKNILKSEMRLQKGYLKVAGLFFSK
jgi:hypothetical protein